MCMCLSDNLLVQDNSVIKFARRRQFGRTNKVLASLINCSCLIFFLFSNFYNCIFHGFTYQLFLLNIFLVLQIFIIVYFSLQLLS